MNAYSIDTSDPEFVLVIWAEQVSHSPRPEHVLALEQLVQQGKPVVFDFSETRVIGTRWLRLTQRLTLQADDMGKELLTVGLDEVLSEKADIIAILDQLHVYPSLEKARTR